jgi:hypothetical protein
VESAEIQNLRLDLLSEFKLLILQKFINTLYLEVVVVIGKVFASSANRESQIFARLAC